MMKRYVFFILGTLCLLLGLAGVLLPVMPGMVFFALAAFFFSHSSQKMHRLLYRTPLLGKALLEWDTSRSLGLQSKLWIIGLFITMSVYPAFFMENKAYAIIMTNFLFVALFTLFAL